MEDLTRDIENNQERRALIEAAELIADEYRDDTKGGEWTPEIQRAVRKAWIVGRDWNRHDQRHMDYRPQMYTSLGGVVVEDWG